MSKPPTVDYGLRRRRSISTLSLCPYYSQTKNTRPKDEYFLCRDPDLNWGHPHFQCDALPTELSRHSTLKLEPKCRAAAAKCQGGRDVLSQSRMTRAVSSAAACGKRCPCPFIS